MTDLEISPFEAPLDKFYDAELEEVPETARKLLEGYSKIPPDLIYPHVLEVREKAWGASPAAAVGEFKFLDIGIASNPAYQEILGILKRPGHQFLDVRCIAGQNLRQLVADGVPSENLYGADRQEFINIGYDLFKDKDSLNSLFLASDVLAKESSLLSQLAGKIDVVYVGDLLETLDWESQVRAIEAIMKLLKPTPHSLIAGRLHGAQVPGEYDVGDETQRRGYRHDKKSFKKMFHTAGDDLKEKWQTDVEVSPWTPSVKLSKAPKAAADGSLLVTFAAKKLERLDEGLPRVVF